MSRNQKDESQQQRAEPDQPLKDANKAVERDPGNMPVQPSDAPKPRDRPDLDWAEHED